MAPREPRAASTWACSPPARSGATLTTVVELPARFGLGATPPHTPLGWVLLFRIAGQETEASRHVLSDFRGLGLPLPLVPHSRPHSGHSRCLWLPGPAARGLSQ